MVRFVRTVGAVALAACLGAAGLGMAQDRGGKFDDAMFVKKAASGGMLEVELGKLAKTMAKNADVQKFGDRMVTDHTKANKELMTIAKGMKVDVPEKMLEEHQKHFDKLKAMTAGFDRAYIDQMVKDHEEDVAAFTKAGQEAKDAKLKEFATKTLPTIKEHLEIAKKLQKELPAK